MCTETGNVWKSFVSNAYSCNNVWWSFGTSDTGTKVHPETLKLFCVILFWVHLAPNYAGLSNFAHARLDEVNQRSSYSEEVTLIVHQKKKAYVIICLYTLITVTCNRFFNVVKYSDEGDGNSTVFLLYIHIQVLISAGMVPWDGLMFCSHLAPAFPTSTATLTRMKQNERVITRYLPHSTVKVVMAHWHFVLGLSLSPHVLVFFFSGTLHTDYAFLSDDLV